MLLNCINKLQRNNSRTTENLRTRVSLVPRPRPLGGAWGATVLIPMFMSRKGKVQPSIVVVRLTC